MGRLSEALVQENEKEGTSWGKFISGKKKKKKKRKKKEELEKSSLKVLK